MKRTIQLFILILFSSQFVNAQKVAYVGVEKSIGKIRDLDERNAAIWLTKQFNGDYLCVDEIDNINLKNYKALWIHVDRWDGVADIYNQLKVKANKIKSYYKDGGNLFLSVHAVQLLNQIGRIDNKPDIVNAEKGGYNDDIWSINPIYGIDCEGPDRIIDRSSDPIYKGMKFKKLKDDTGHEFKYFPLMGPGWKEDHNCFWSMTVADHPIINESKSKILYWEKRYNAKTLGTWGQVKDYFGAAIVRFYPTKEFKGKCITVSLGAYEWHSNSSTPNSYQHNIEILTTNIIQELLK